MNMRLWGLVIELCEDVCVLGRARVGGYSFRFLHCFLSTFSRRPFLHMILQLKLNCSPHRDGLKTSTTVSPDKLPLPLLLPDRCHSGGTVTNPPFLDASCDCNPPAFPGLGSQMPPGWDKQLTFC